MAYQAFAWRRLALLVTAVLTATCTCLAGPRSGDAYVEQAGSRWSFGTSRVERVVEFVEGRPQLV